MTVAVYAGSFDPPTYGHLSVVAQAARVFDSFIIAIGHNSAKQGLFSVDERMALLREATADWDNIRIVSFEGLLMDYCKGLLERCQRVVIVRGLRAVSDFESEMGIADVNRRICPEITTLFIPTQANHAFISSSAAKEMARYSGAHEALLQYVPENVAEALIERSSRPTSSPPQSIRVPAALAEGFPRKSEGASEEVEKSVGCL